MEVGKDEVTLRMGKQANRRSIQFALQALLAVFGEFYRLRPGNWTSVEHTATQYYAVLSSSPFMVFAFDSGCLTPSFCKEAIH